MKKYQPERTDLLINTEWGIAEEEVSKDEAQQRGLVLFKGRWVAPDESTKLAIEIVAYRAIRLLAGVICLFAAYSAYALLFNISRKAPVGALVMLAIVVFAYVAAAIGLYMFKQWAYYVTMVLMAISIFQSFIARRYFLLVIAVVVIVALIRKPFRRIFFPPKQEPAPS